MEGGVPGNQDRPKYATDTDDDKRTTNTHCTDQFEVVD